MSTSVTHPESPTPKSAYPVTEFRSVRSKPSVEESAGEEILYPRSPAKARQRDSSVPALPSETPANLASHHSASKPATISSRGAPISLSGPGLSSAGSTHRHRKRPSDETSPRATGKTAGSPSSPNDDTHARRRSLNVAAPTVPPISQQRERDKERERIKDRRRQDAANSVITRSNSTSKDTSSRDRHLRRSSASAATSSSPPTSQGIESNLSRRTHDFSHLPPSPGSNALQHILKNTAVNHAGTPPPPPNQGSISSNTSVAHSLLRGTQEGWSGMDDSATAEALRKLDGISGRSLRARSSIISVASKSSSRPGTPGSKSGHQQWEGLESAPLVKRRSSAGLNSRDTVSGTSSGQTTVAPTPAQAQEREHEELDMTVVKSSTTPMSTRSTGPSPVKRSSGGSSHTHFTSTGTPTSGSRDSTSVSTSTSVTSTHASSRRHSLTLSGKLKRSNSTGSDTSSIHSEKDRAASLASLGDVEQAQIPPVPPLPKAYQTPPGSASLITTHPNGPSTHEDLNRPIFIPPIEVQSPPSAHSASPSKSSHTTPQAVSVSPSTTATRTPSKKWSFSGLNLRLPSSSTKDGANPGLQSPLSPRKGSTSRNVSGSSPQVKQRQLPERNSSSVERDRDGSSPFNSSSSLAHPRQSPSPRLSSSSLRQGQMPFPASHPPPVPSPTRRSIDQTRPDSNNSHYTNTTSRRTTKDAPANSSPSRRPSTTRRLTPSSIPFFRRSSTHSINSAVANGSAGGGPTSSLASPRTPATGLSPSSPLMPVISNGLPGQGGAHATPPSLTRATPPTVDITSSPGSSSQRKSVLMGLPSLLKGSNSRRSLHGGEKSDAEKRQREERSREREREKEREKEKAREEKERRKEEKKEEKERSESRISVLMGRRRGKVI